MDRDLRCPGTLTVLLALAWLATAACGDPSGNGADPDGRPADASDVPVGDAPDAGPDTACPAALSYVDPVEMPVEGYHLQLVFNGERALRVRATACDAPVAGATVTFEEVADDAGVCVLDATSATTGADGVATVRVASPQDTLAGDCRIRACLGADCVEFRVVVTCKCLVPLVVGFEPYAGSQPQVNAGRVSLYRRDAGGRPGCSDLPWDDWTLAPTAQLGPVSILSTVQFPTLPHLAEGEETSQAYTVRCVAGNGDGPALAYGCLDDVRVELGARTFVACPLADGPPRQAGTYDLASTFDLQTGLPPGPKAVLDFLLGFFAHPSLTMMRLACDPALWASSDLQAFCTALFEDPANPSVDALTPAGEAMRQILDTHLAGLLVRQCPYGDPQLCTVPWYTGEDLGDVLRHVTLLSTMTCTQEPGADGVIPTGGCHEEWHTLRVPGLHGGAPVDLSLASLPGVEASVQAELDVRLAQGRSRMHVAAHPVRLSFAVLVAFLTEKILLPQVFGDGSDGLPAVDGLEALMGALVAGSACLQSGTCCAEFAENLAGQAGGAVTALQAEAACDALVTAGATYVRGFLLDLSQPPADLVLGTPADNPCVLRDRDHDMAWDAMGLPTDPCAWDAHLVVGQQDFAPAASFVGARR